VSILIDNECKELGQLLLLLDLLIVSITDRSGIHNLKIQRTAALL
jgi:hypothetical protein